MDIHSYPKVYNLGHPAIRDLFSDPVVCQEKVDGSQFSFVCDASGMLHFRSKGAVVYPQDSNKLFRPAVDYLMGIPAGRFIPNAVYRGEVLTRRKHNTLTYDRTPSGYVVLFDVETGDQDFLHPNYVGECAELIGVDVVPRFEVDITDMAALAAALDRESFLGGPRVEGLVFKNYSRFGRDGKVLMGKHVSEAFKEQHNSDWKGRNPTRADVIESLVARYRTEARWRKAVQHLAERGELEDDPRDIGKLFKEVHLDFAEECADEVKEILWQHFKQKLTKGVASGLPEWYKGELAAKQFQSV